MKKKNFMLRSLTLMMVLAMCFSFAACGGGGGTDIGGDETTGNGGDTGKTFAFVHNNIKIAPNALVGPLITALGSDYEYFESPSCAFIGMDKIYMYKGFHIYTYPDDKAVDHVLQIILTDDSVSTPEGLMIGHPAAKVTELYGTNYEQSGENFAYTLGKTSLKVIIKDGRVSSIQYGYTDAAQ